MRITIELNQPSWLANRPRLKKTLVLAVFLGLLVIPGTVIAGHQFADVPNGQPFHTQIGAIRDAGITSGSTECGSPPPGQTFYCPESLVRRDAMAAFMHRGYARTGRGEKEWDPTPLGTALLGAKVTMSNGGVTGGSGFLHVTGTVTVVESDGGQPCPCRLQMELRLNDGEAASPVVLADIPATQVVFGGGPRGTSGTATATWVFPVDSGTQDEVSVVYLVSGDDSGADDEVGSVSQITAVYIPFSNDGDNSLAES